MDKNELIKIMNIQIFEVEDRGNGDFRVKVPLYWGEGWYALYIDDDKDGYFSVHDGSVTLGQMARYNNTPWDEDFVKQINFRAERLGFKIVEDEVFIKKVKKEEIQITVLKLIQLISMVYSL